MPLVQTAPIILASGSSIRQQMLRAVGLGFSVEPSGVEEDTIKQRYAGRPVPEIASALAEAKTLAVSKNNPKAYVIGADQMCVLHGKVLSKPGSYDRAKAQLAELAGKTHEQHCAMTLAQGGEVLWRFHEVATLTMRELTSDEIDMYVAIDAPLQSCGAYKFEGLGRHLFASVQGDHDVIQGLALVPLLAELHRRKIITMMAA